MRRFIVGFIPCVPAISKVILLFFIFSLCKPRISLPKLRVGYIAVYIFFH